MMPSTMSPSLKYLIVASTAAAKASASPMSFTAIWLTLGVSMMEVMEWKAPADWCGDGCDGGP
ncbi:unannotated protein [freshwater metagenome]|uniref:Unannotated protein n=1 Tax=freshwater metagenome TaxID=449393 RepID=A0A6J7C564_9ZZZZ